jgi:hypothetical protein
VSVLASEIAKDSNCVSINLPVAATVSVLASEIAKDSDCVSISLPVAATVSVLASEIAEDSNSFSKLRQLKSLFDFASFTLNDSNSSLMSDFTVSG